MSPKFATNNDLANKLDEQTTKTTTHTNNTSIDNSPATRRLARTSVPRVASDSMSSSALQNTSSGGDKCEPANVKSIMEAAQQRCDELRRLLDEHEELVNEINRVESRAKMSLSTATSSLSASVCKDELVSSPDSSSCLSSLKNNHNNKTTAFSAADSSKE